MAQVKVLIVGQDPYPTPGHPIGLSFAVDRHVRPVPRSLGNIYKELRADTGIVPPAHGDLTAWSDQGVLLLNRVLTVEPGRPASHRGKGWEPITEAAIRALVARGGPLVAILWGKDAQTLRPLLDQTPIIASAHPSPMSADRGSWVETLFQGQCVVARAGRRTGRLGVVTPSRPGSGGPGEDSDSHRLRTNLFGTIHVRTIRLRTPGPGG